MRIAIEAIVGGINCDGSALHGGGLCRLEKEEVRIWGVEGWLLMEEWGGMRRGRVGMRVREDGVGSMGVLGCVRWEVVMRVLVGWEGRRGLWTDGCTCG